MRLRVCMCVFVCVRVKYVCEVGVRECGQLKACFILLTLKGFMDWMHFTR